MIKKIIKNMLIYYFSSFLISFKNVSRNYYENILWLIFPFVTFVGSVATSGSVAASGVGLRVGNLSNFCIGNNQLLKLLRTFSLTLSNNAKLFKRDFFQITCTFFRNTF